MPGSKKGNTCKRISRKSSIEFSKTSNSSDASSDKNSEEAYWNQDDSIMTSIADSEKSSKKKVSN